MPIYREAAICLNGHVIDDMLVAENIDQGPIPDYCADCAAKVLTNCPDCPTPLRGRREGRLGHQAPANFCEACGAVMPWAGREAIAAKMLRDLSEGISDPAERLRIKEQVHAFADPEKSEAVRVRAGNWLKKRAAPAAWNAVSQLLYSLAHAEIRSKLGLPPSP